MGLERVNRQLEIDQRNGDLMMDLGVIVQAVIGAAAGAFGAYVAIRSDLAALKAKMEIHERSLERAHERIDSLK